MKRFQFTTRKMFWFVAIVALYLHTWIGGWRAHHKQMQLEAERRYKSTVARNEAEAIEAKQQGRQPDPFELNENGPTGEVNWGIPLLPGLMLVDSAYYVGPVHASGTTKLILFYGYGTVTLCELFGWRA